MIPKNMMQIWIGPRPAPSDWMQTWRDLHQDWDYTLIDNDYVASRTFRNQTLIDEYLKRAEYPGAADLIRYEMLLEKGGFMPAADSICKQNTDQLWVAPKAYTVFENEFVRGKMVSPILACDPGNSFVDALVERLHQLKPEHLNKAWRTTGNYFVACMIEELSPDITVFPSHYFIPEHFTGHRYTGDGPVFCNQLFGETTGGYAKPGIAGKWQKIKGRIRSSRMRRKL